MKRLQRRTKHSAAASVSNTTTHALSAQIGNYQNILVTRWQALPPRDQLALAVLFVFLLLFIGGYGGYSIHQAAKTSKIDYQEQVSDYFWLRAQASNIDNNALSASNTANGVAAMPPTNRISALLNNSGITDAQVVAAGDSVQLRFVHPSQAVVSTALGKLKQQGWQFMQLSMQQNLADKSIEVQATVTS